MADTPSTTAPSPAVLSVNPTKVPHSRLSFLNNLYGLYCDQGLFFTAVNDGDVRARAAFRGSVGMDILRRWMEEARVEIVSHYFCFAFNCLMI